MIKMSVWKIISKLQKLAEENPEQKITIETGKHHSYECPYCGKEAAWVQELATCKLSDAIIYEGFDGTIVIDSE